MESNAPRASVFRADPPRAERRTRSVARRRLRALARTAQNGLHPRSRCGSRPAVSLARSRAPRQSTMKFPELVPVPSPVVTVILPVVAPSGTTATILVELITVYVSADRPLKDTFVAPAKLLPKIATGVPTKPAPGTKELMTGGWVTRKSVELVPVPLCVVTVIRPVEALLGTVALMRPSLETEKLALTPLKRTLVVPPTKLHLSVATGPPAKPERRTDVIECGRRVTPKSAELVAVPLALVTVIRPVVALLGTVALMRVSEATE